MPRVSLPLLALFVVGCVGALSYSCATRVQSTGVAPADGNKPMAVSSADAGDAVPSPQRADANSEQALAGASSDARSSQAVPAATVEKWISEATGEEARARAAAIVALSGAPRSQAIPVLEKVLNTGEPGVDRPLALQSLRELALLQGDADGRVRDVLRHAIYHGSDEASSLGAQAALDDVEAALVPDASKVSR